MLHVGNLFPTKEGARKGQHSTSQCRPKLQPNNKRNFSKDSKLFGQMDWVNRQSRGFRYCFGLSNELFRDPSSAETSNSIQPVQRGGEVGRFGGGETPEEGGYTGGGTLQKPSSVKHFDNTQERGREKAGGRHEGPEQFHRTSSFQNGRFFAPAIHLPEGHFMCTKDLQDVYQTIPIAKKSRIYLRFLWKGRLYQFTCLPFDLRSSPRIFT